ncbi:MULTISPECIES: dihydroxyacetone kinase phosphoryl donor subunit DhaM [unclassified Ensifer]|uniref:dihydroxyacetone kinase phosphoryl donor subunit DhaM n=1 Tax=unclassified Ensifer TaxID=2633371 RepID=UPI00081382CF|nr:MULTISPECIES: dihydroxyacetone kinase phosphoryl donor subunit DhaM [unclassified Ensifer]OCP23582.1 PTS-dependent dihydroxyacetone kinase phosphotransferase subunit DhaM [Ensifer sp. LC384]OCP24269.1 PTS-dependent dihydroxyacetone kinase phosphotransferase subunit DhaM [Ensifer sp. LC54]
MNRNVALVIVSHSKAVAEGTRDMVRQMVGGEVDVVACGGNAEGGLGTNIVEIIAALKSVCRPQGVLIFVDLGGAETNSEMAIEMLPPEHQAYFAICDAAIVEGAIMAATEAVSGAALEQVRAAAEEYKS